jgi:hypothetical protein
MKKYGTVLLVIGGLALLGLGVYYLYTPAGSLVSFLPGHEVGSSHKHLKHGAASILLGLGLWVWAWFNSSPSKKENS